jgi:hypothetical protein
MRRLRYGAGAICSNIRRPAHIPETVVVLPTEPASESNLASAPNELCIEFVTGGEVTLFGPASGCVLIVRINVVCKSPFARQSRASARLAIRAVPRIHIIMENGNVTLEGVVE